MFSLKKENWQQQVVPKSRHNESRMNLNKIWSVVSIDFVSSYETAALVIYIGKWVLLKEVWYCEKVLPNQCFSEDSRPKLRSSKNVLCEFLSQVA